MKSGNLNFLETSGPLQACNGTALTLPWSYCCCPGVNSTLLLLGMSMSTSLADLKTSSAPGCPFPEFLGHGISLSPLSIQDNRVLMPALRREYEHQTARSLRSADNVYCRIFLICRCVKPGLSA